MYISAEMWERILNLLALRTGTNRPDWSYRTRSAFFGGSLVLQFGTLRTFTIQSNHAHSKIIHGFGSGRGSIHDVTFVPWEYFEAIIHRLTPAVSTGYVKAWMNRVFWEAARPASTRIEPLHNRPGEFVLKNHAYRYILGDDTIVSTNEPHTFGMDFVRGSVVFRGVACNGIHASRAAMIRDEGHNEVIHIDNLPNGALVVGTNYIHDDLYITAYQLPQTAKAAGFLNYSAKVEQYVPDNMFKIAPADLYRSGKDVPYLGFELEGVISAPLTQRNFSKQASETMDRHSITKSDGSLPRGGVEVVSTPCTLDYWKYFKLKDKIETLRQSGLRSYDYTECGFHIHVSRNALSVLDLYKLERFIHNPDNKEFLCVVAGRRENTYSKYTKTRFNGRKDLKHTGGRSLSNHGLTQAIDALRVYDTMDRIGLSWLKIFMKYLYRETSFSALEEFSGQSTDFLFQLSRNFDVTPDAFYARNVHFVGRLQEFMEHLRSLTNPRESNNPLTSSVSWKAKHPTKRSESHFVMGDTTLAVGKTDLGRYDALNCANKNTVEFRMFKGTVCPERIMSYLEFVEAVVRFVQQSSNESTGFEDFVRWLNSSFNRRRYEHLCSYLIQSNLLKAAMRNAPTFTQNSNS
jgi:hypothetical protein